MTWPKKANRRNKSEDSGDACGHRRNAGLARKEARLGYLLVLPALFCVLAIVLFPMVWNIVLSFQPIRLADLAHIDLLDFSHLSLDNYATALGRGFWSSLEVTLVFSFFGTALSIGVGLWAALAFNRQFTGRRIFRALLLFPYVAPLITSAFIWRFMLDTHIGIVNAALKIFEVEPIAWLTTQSMPLHLLGVTIPLPVALITVVVFEGWRYFPFAFLFLLARMQSIPGELYDAARVDGAGPWQQFRYVTLPHLRTAIGILFLLRFLWAFFKFDDIFLLNGGTAGMHVISIQIYNWLFARRNVGVAASIGVLLAVLLITAAVLCRRWLSAREEVS